MAAAGVDGTADCGAAGGSGENTATGGANEGEVTQGGWVFGSGVPYDGGGMATGGVGICADDGWPQGAD